MRAAKESGLDPPEVLNRRMAGIDVSLYNKKNAGVDERDNRDKLDIKARHRPELLLLTPPWAACHAPSSALVQSSSLLVYTVVLSTWYGNSECLT